MDTLYNGLYGEALPERETFFWVGISRAEAKERLGNLSFRYFKGNFKISRTEPTRKDRNVSTVGM